MFHHCTNIIISEANRYIQSKIDSKVQHISLAMLGNFPIESKSQEGIKMRLADIANTMLKNSSIESKSQEGIRMRLVDIANVDICSNPNEYVPQGNGFVLRKVPEAFSLYFLFSVNYEEKYLIKNLELLSYIAAFFQHKPHFDTQNTPSLQAVGIENFSIELVKMTDAEKSILWRNLSIPYSPSLLYKAGLLFVGDASTNLQASSAALVSFKR